MQSWDYTATVVGYLNVYLNPGDTVTVHTLGLTWDRFALRHPLSHSRLAALHVSLGSWIEYILLNCLQMKFSHYHRPLIYTGQINAHSYISCCPFHIVSTLSNRRPQLHLLPDESISASRELELYHSLPVALRWHITDMASFVRLFNVCLLHRCLSLQDSCEKVYAAVLTAFASSFWERAWVSTLPVHDSEFILTGPSCWLI